MPPIALLFEAQFKLSDSKLFDWFFATYNIGLGHIVLTVAFVLFFVALGRRLNSRNNGTGTIAGANAPSAASATS